MSTHRKPTSRPPGHRRRTVASLAPSHLRPLAQPHRVLVRVQGDGMPSAVREGWRWSRVEAVQESWRIDDEWWRRIVSRAYHRVILEDGGLRTLYQDLEQGEWFLHA